MTYRKSGATPYGPAEFTKGSLIQDRNGNLRKVTGSDADMNVTIAALIWIVAACWDVAVLVCIWPFEAIVRLKFWPPLTHKLIVNPNLAWT